jgi:hypothetical protein
MKKLIVRSISEHIKNIFDSDELEYGSTVRKFRTVAANGKTYEMDHYDLDMIITLGYRVNSKVATAFRKWATERLRHTSSDGGGGHLQQDRCRQKIHGVNSFCRRPY